MRKLYFAGCVFAAVACLGGCTKTNDIEPVSKGVDFFAHVDNVDTKTSIDGLQVLWEKKDSIAIQVTKNHLYNASNPGAYTTTLGIYKLADDAAGTSVGRFTYSRGGEQITGDEGFFAFYPASYCTAHKDNGYFYVDFPMTQYYEDNIGDKLPLPMYGIGSNRNVSFNYAGAVLKLRVWSKEKTSIHSCVISADNLSKKAFTYVKDGKWLTKLCNAHTVQNLNMKMRNPLEISNVESDPTVITMIIPLADTTILKNLKFSINCEKGGSELTKKSGLRVKPGTVVTFPVKELTIEPDRMFVDGLEGEIDTEWVKTAKDSVKVTMVSASKLHEDVFRDIMKATRSLENKIVLDLSGANAEKSILQGLTDNKYVGFCGGSNRDKGIKNISKFYLPEGIATILNRAFSYSDYTEIVLPSTLTKISGSPSNGCDSLVWKVAEGNKSFKADEEGALYDFGMTTLMVLNGGSGDSYTVKDGTTTIREWALYENSIIKTLTIPASVTKLSADCISGTPNLTTIICLGKEPAEFKPNTGKNKVGPANQTKTLYVPTGCGKNYEAKWKTLLAEGNWKVVEQN
jgi:surface antigen bspA-like protein